MQSTWGPSSLLWILKIFERQSRRRAFSFSSFFSLSLVFCALQLPRRMSGLQIKIQIYAIKNLPFHTYEQPNTVLKRTTPKQFPYSTVTFGLCQDKIRHGLPTRVHGIDYRISSVQGFLNGSAESGWRLGVDFWKWNDNYVYWITWHCQVVNMESNYI